MDSSTSTGITSRKVTTGGVSSCSSRQNNVEPARLNATITSKLANSNTDQNHADGNACINNSLPPKPDSGGKPISNTASTINSTPSIGGSARPGSMRTATGPRASHTGPDSRDNAAAAQVQSKGQYSAPPHAGGVATVIAAIRGPTETRTNHATSARNVPAASTPSAAN